MQLSDKENDTGKAPLHAQNSFCISFGGASFQLSILTAVFIFPFSAMRFRNRSPWRSQVIGEPRSPIGSSVVQRGTVMKSGLNIARKSKGEKDNR